MVAIAAHKPVSPRQRALLSTDSLHTPLLLISTGAIGLVSGLSVVVFIAALATLSVGAWRVARSVFRTHIADDTVLVTWTLAIAWLAIVAEALSLGHWLGSETGWLVGCLALYVGSLASPPARRPVDWRTPLAPIRSLSLPGRLVALAASLPILWLSVVVWFSGITVADAFRVYLARAVLYLQHGTFNVYSTELDYLQYLHATLVAFPMLFLRNDVHVNALSMAATMLASVAAAAYARLLGWWGWFPLAAALISWTMPKIILSAPTAGFDTLAAVWIVLSLYFLRRGFAALSPRWLALAALAAGLGIATKATFYFAIFGLAVLWGWCLLRGLRRRRRRRAVQSTLAAVAAVVLVGCPFLIRNYALGGYLLAPPSEFGNLTNQHAYSFDPRARFLALTVTALGYGVQLATPPYWLPESVNRAVEPWYFDQLDWLQARREVWPWQPGGLLVHATDRYDSAMAGFGAPVVLVLMPAVLALPWAARRIGPRRLFAWWPAWLAGSYFIVLSVAIPISPHSNRYLIEWGLILAAITPALFTILPRRIAGVGAIVLAVPLMLEQYDALTHSRHLPPTVVTWMSRERQVYELFGYHDPQTRLGVETFDRRYPPRAFPVVYLARRFDAAYLFNGPSLQRQGVFWTPPESGLVDLPGLTLTQDPQLVERLGRQRDIRVDQLSATVWVLLPR